jgi:hypothetical protein
MLPLLERLAPDADASEDILDRNAARLFAGSGGAQ